VSDAGSSVPRRQLGRELKRARERAGVSLEAAARELEFSRNKIYRIEGGSTPLRKVDVLAMAGLYGVTPDLADVLVALAAETKAKGWWHSYGDAMPDWFELYVSLEAASTHLRHYAPSIVPGLLQTREYAAAVFQANPIHSDVDVDRLVALRLERQRLLARRAPKPPALSVVLDEAVLRRPIADSTGMAKQVEHLAAMSQKPNVEIRVLPLAVGPHRASQAGAFVILDFRAEGARQPEPTTIYSESLTGALYLDKSQEVEIYDGVWRLLGELALGTDESRSLIELIAKENLDV
jgi:transcriptional regulator with XRE-family HTH domain